MPSEKPPGRKPHFPHLHHIGLITPFESGIPALLMLYYYPTPHGGGYVGNGDEFMNKQDVLQRLKTVSGHVRGIERMVEEDTYCIDLIRQIQAVQAALGKISVKILDDHLHSCVLTAVKGDDPAQRERVLEEIAEVYEMASKV